MQEIGKSERSEPESGIAEDVTTVWEMGKLHGRLLLNVDLVEIENGLSQSGERSELRAGCFRFGVPLIQEGLGLVGMGLEMNELLVVYLRE